MFDRVPAQPAGIECSAIALAKRGEPMSDLVRDDGDQQDWREQQYGLESMQRGRAKSAGSDRAIELNALR